MSYLEQAVASVADIIPSILAFANSKGWTVAGNDLTRPGGGRTFTLTSVVASDNAYLQITDKLVPARRSYTTSPRRRNAVLAPTKLHLFSDTVEGAPYIAVVIEFGYNVYRHLYIGSAVKMGDYDGGEIISSNDWCEAYTGQTLQVAFNSAQNRYMFSAAHDHATGNGQAAGGVNIEHPDNPVPWRSFDGVQQGSFSLMNNWQGSTVFGGWSDSINSIYAARGLSSFASANILTPINLYGPRATDGANYRFVPFGYVPGVSLIRLDGIDPAETIEVAGKSFKVFPEFSRDVRTIASRANGAYWDFETSWFLGLAYAMD